MRAVFSENEQYTFSFLTFHLEIVFGINPAFRQEELLE